MNSYINQNIGPSPYNSKGLTLTTKWAKPPTSTNSAEIKREPDHLCNHPHEHGADQTGFE